MVFADLFFMYFFLPLCLICYFITKKLKYRNIVLVVFSLVFYAWGEPKLILILLLSTFFNWIFGLIIGKNNESSAAKITLAISLIFNIGMLGVFKYSGFIVENINSLLGLNLTAPNLTLPIGISFYTFQILSYVIDVYWGKVSSQKSYHKFLMYVSLFPQLVAGPIVRYSDIAAEIDNRRTKLSDLSDGLSRVILGIAKKVIVANSLNTIVLNSFGDMSDGFKGLDSVSTVGTWLGIVVIGLWYYFDFSGYSDIAIGLGRIFGFNFNENFNYPYISKSITEFWQRWHISLGSFFRDYLLYVPIFGKRRKYGGLFLVWFCTGLWHGASWNFILWGLYYGLFIVLEMKIGKKKMKKMNPVLAHIYMIVVVAIGYGIFYFEDIASLGQFFKCVAGFGGNGFVNSSVGTILKNNVFLLLAAALLSTPIVKKIRELGSRSTGACVTVNTLGIVLNAAMLMVSTLFLMNNTNNPFLYFRF